MLPTLPLEYITNLNCYFLIKKSNTLNMVEVLLSGIVLGLVPCTITGLFVAAYLQYRRVNQFGL